MSSLSEQPRRRLERLDDAVVPRLQRGARGLARVLGAPLRGLSWLEERTGPVFRVTNRHRGALLLAAVSIATAGSAVHFERFPELRQQAAEEAAVAREQDVVVPRSEEAGSEAVAVGAPVGEPLEQYIEARREVLSSLPPAEERVGVVSLHDYHSATTVVELLPDGLAVSSAQYRLPGPLPQERPLQTEVVGGDLVGSMERVVEAALSDIEREVADVESTLQTEGMSEDFAADYRARLDELRAMANVLRSEAAIVFAVVVEGPVEDLRTVEQASPVRLVDPAPPDAEPAVSPLFGILPEDGEEATYGVAS